MQTRTKVKLGEINSHYKNNTSVLYVSPERLKANLGKITELKADQVEDILDRITEKNESKSIGRSNSK